MGMIDPATPIASVGDLLASPGHAGPIAGASSVGQAQRRGRSVRIAVWRSGGRIVRARFDASSCAALIASAELACRALEAGVPPERLDAAALRARIAGLHPAHRDRADLVAEALRALEEPGAREHEPPG